MPFQVLEVYQRPFLAGVVALQPFSEAGPVWPFLEAEPVRPFLEAGQVWPFLEAELVQPFWAKAFLIGVRFRGMTEKTPF